MRCRLVTLVADKHFAVPCITFGTQCHDWNKTEASAYNKLQVPWSLYVILTGMQQLVLKPSPTLLR